jgi:cytidine deaminase
MNTFREQKGTYCPSFSIKLYFWANQNRMVQKELKIYYAEFNSAEELSEPDQRLLYCARNAAGRAYAPYSKFNVGSAVLLGNGEIIDGNNQENAAYTNGLCAERVALFTSHSKFPDEPVQTIAITARNSSGLLTEPVKPCGSCRQVLIETEVRFGNKVRIILDGKECIQVFEGIENLLPFAFKPEALG